MANSGDEVGIRLFLVGKDLVISGLAETSRGVDKLLASQVRLSGGTDRLSASTVRWNKVLAATRDEAVADSLAMDDLAASIGHANLEMDVAIASGARYTAQMETMAKVGRAAFFGIAIASTAAAYESIKWATQYQTQLTRLQTQAGLTARAVGSVGRAAMTNAASLGISPTAYLQAAYHPASAGLSTASIIGVANQAANLTAIGGADSEDNSNSLTALMKVYGTKGAKGAARQAAMINAIVGSGNMTATDMNEAIGTAVFTSGQQFGLSEGAVGSALDLMTDRGMNAAQAATRLRMGIALLGAPSQQASKYERDIGLGTKTSANSAMSQLLSAGGLTTTRLDADLRRNGGKNGLYNALHDIKQSLEAGGVPQSQQATYISRVFGGGRSGAAIEQAYQNLPALNRKGAQIASLASQTKYLNDLAKAHGTLAFQVHSLDASVKQLGTTFGTDLVPVLKVSVEMLGGMTRFLAHNKALVLGLGGAVTAVLAPALGVYLVRSFLGAGGAIRTVIGSYATLMQRMTANRVAMGLQDGSLAVNDAAEATNAAAVSADTAALTANDAARGAGGFGGLGGPAALIATAGWFGGHALNNTLASHHVFGEVNATTWTQLMKANELRNSMSPAKKRVLASLASGATFDPHLSQFSAMRQLDAADLAVPLTPKRDLPTSESNGQVLNAQGHVIHNHYVTVEIDGKKVTETVVKRIRQKSSRM